MKSLLITFGEWKRAWPNDRWEKEGKPRLWITVETLTIGDDVYEARIDVGYGFVGLFLNSKEIDKGKNFASDNDGIVVLDKDYYNTKSYFFVSPIRRLENVAVQQHSDQ